ncbi:MgtC/SapB family protein [soil metagenome]
MGVLLGDVRDPLTDLRGGVTLTPVAATIWSLLVGSLCGLLIGLERERKRETRGSIFAGVRTFTLISLFGTLTGQLAVATVYWVLVAALLVLGTLLTAAYWRASGGEKVGGTSEIAALVAFSAGALAGYGQLTVALAAAVITTFVLSLRIELHDLAGSMRREDLFAVIQLEAVSLVVLPLVPDKNYGPWGVWNPHTIWLLVVLISGVSFVGYVASKSVGMHKGIGLSAVLGGLASSTATTLSYSERSKAHPGLSRVMAAGALIASAVMVPRLLVILSVVQMPLIKAVAVPYGILFLITAVGGVTAFWRSKQHASEGVKLTNPFELVSAIRFAVVFAAVLLVARAAEVYFGEGGIYLASVLAGLVRPDAIILTLSDQINAGLDVEVAARGLSLAVASNTLLKAGMAVALGTRRFGRFVLLTLLVAAAACVAAAWLFPANLFG